MLQIPVDIVDSDFASKYAYARFGIQYEVQSMPCAGFISRTEALFLEVNWLKGLLREVMVCKFIWVSKNKEINAITEEHVSLQIDEAKQVFDFPTLCLFFNFVGLHYDTLKATSKLICTVWDQIDVTKYFGANIHDLYCHEINF